MNRRLIAVFGFALLVASGASFFIYRVIVLHVQSPVHEAVARNSLVVAVHDLQVGALIHDSDVRQVSWGGSLPAQTAGKTQDVIGRGVIATIYANEPILNIRLAAKGAGAGLAATIPMGKRAVALRVDEVVGLAGFVLPGMRVDVLVAGNPPGGDQNRLGTLSRTVLQNIEVLSAGQKIEKNTDGKPETVQVVNLLVTPDQAETLNLASIETKVQLVLRNPLDTQEEVTRGTSIAKLFGADFAERPAALRSPLMLPLRRAVAFAPIHRDLDTTTVEVFNGTKKTEQKFEASQENK
ncbi:MAG: Flp pilus assembly protein CpaB [Bryobacteraceae bacterium]